MENKIKYTPTEKKNLFLMLAGVLVSRTGTLAFSFAVGLYILRTTGSPMGLAVSVLMATVPKLIVSPYAGLLADRLDRKILVVGGDIASGIALLVLLSMSVVPVWSLYLIIVFLSVVQTFFDVAFQSSQPDLVSEDNLFQLNAYTQSATSFAEIVGPALGGLLLAMSMKAIILVNGLSFVLSGVSEFFIDFKYNRKEKPTSEEPLAQKKSMSMEYKEAFDFLKSNKLILYVVGLSLGINLFIGLAIRVPLPYLMNTLLELEPTTMGLIEATLSMGVFIAGMILGKKGPGNLYKSTLGFGLVIGAMIFLMGLPFAFSTSYPELTAALMLMALHFVVGYALPNFVVPIITMEQKLIPENIRGKVFSLIGMLAGVGIPITVIISVYAMEVVETTSLLMFSGLAIMVLSFLVMSRKTVKEAFRQDDQVKATKATSDQIS